MLNIHTPITIFTPPSFYHGSGLRDLLISVLFIMYILPNKVPIIDGTLRIDNESYGMCLTESAITVLSWDSSRPIL